MFNLGLLDLGEYLQLFNEPGNFRFFVQPTVAMIIAARDGVLDAKAGTPPFLVRYLMGGKEAWAAEKSELGSLAALLVLFTMLEIVTHQFVFGSVYLLSSLIVAVTLLLIPYGIVRGLTNRIVRHKYQKTGHDSKA